MPLLTYDWHPQDPTGAVNAYLRGLSIRREREQDQAKQMEALGKNILAAQNEQRLERADQLRLQYQEEEGARRERIAGITHPADPGYQIPPSLLPGSSPALPEPATAAPAPSPNGSSIALGYGPPSSDLQNFPQTIPSTGEILSGVEGNAGTGIGFPIAAGFNSALQGANQALNTPSDTIAPEVQAGPASLTNPSDLPTGAGLVNGNDGALFATGSTAPAPGVQRTGGAQIALEPWQVDLVNQAPTGKVKSALTVKFASDNAKALVQKRATGPRLQAKADTEGNLMAFNPATGRMEPVAGAEGHKFGPAGQKTEAELTAGMNFVPEHNTYRKSDGSEWFVTGGKLTSYRPMQVKASRWAQGDDGEVYPLGKNGEMLKPVPDGVHLNLSGGKVQTVRDNSGNILVLNGDGKSATMLVPAGLKLTSAETKEYLELVSEVSEKTVALEGLKKNKWLFGSSQSEIDKAQKEIDAAKDKVKEYHRLFPQLATAPLAPQAPALTPAPVAPAAGDKYPVGSVATKDGKKYVKTAQGWLPQ